LLWDLGQLPDVVIYPTGGGTGLIGMAKAFDEMETLGWIGSERPKLVSVQMDGCAPIVRAFHAGADTAKAWQDPSVTAAFGLRVPGALGDFLMLRDLRATQGTAVAVTENEMLAGVERCGRTMGLWPCPEGGACVAAAAKLRAQDFIQANDVVALFNTGSPLKYL
jgi:threonine synthase